MMNTSLRNNARQVKTNVQWCWLPSNFNKSTQEELSTNNNVWVKILDSESLGIDENEEALLLCEASDSKWVTWLPSIGEKVLKTNQFCLTPN